eukprot:COSAG05_NODE_932_length_6542_cov_8.110818_4_plen_176_part_00
MRQWQAEADAAEADTTLLQPLQPPVAAETPGVPALVDRLSADDDDSGGDEDTSSDGEEYSSDELDALGGGSASKAEVILMIMNPENGHVYTPSNSSRRPSMLKVLEKVMVDTRTCESILQGVIKPLSKALNFTAAERQAAVANTSQYGIQVNTPWRILKSGDSSVCPARPAASSS